MIGSFQDKRTEAFYRGERISSFSGSARAAERKLDQLDAVTGLSDLARPGETLREDLDALGMSAAELARQVKVPVNRITGIMNGKRSVTGDTALRLGRFFGTSGEFWLNLQKLYELRLAEVERGAEIATLPVFDPEAWQYRGSAEPVLV